MNTAKREEIQTLITRTDQNQAVIRWILDHPYATRKEIAEYMLDQNDKFTKLAQTMLDEAKQKQTLGITEGNEIHKDYDYE